MIGLTPVDHYVQALRRWTLLRAQLYSLRKSLI